MLRKCLSILFVSLSCCALCNTTASADLVNLSFLPAGQSVVAGNNFSIDLYAISNGTNNLSISDIDAILNWNPSMLQLTGLVNAGPYSWLSSNFPNDSGLDGLNAPFGPVPGNDGNALYRAQRNFSNPAIATPSGLLVTRFNFKALAETASTSLCIAPSAGLFTTTFVVDGFSAGLDITGALGCASVQIVPEAGACLLLGMATVLISRRSR